MTTLLSRIHDIEVCKLGRNFVVRFPVPGEDDYTICCTSDHGRAMAELTQFLEEVNAALDELEALQ